VIAGGFFACGHGIFVLPLWFCRYVQVIQGS